MFFFTYAGPQSLQPFSAEGLKMLKYYIKRTICCSLIKFKKKKIIKKRKLWYLFYQGL